MFQTNPLSPMKNVLNISLFPPKFCKYVFSRQNEDGEISLCLAGTEGAGEKAKTWRAPLYNIAMVPDAPYIDLGVKLHHTTPLLPPPLSPLQGFRNLRKFAKKELSQRASRIIELCLEIRLGPLHIFNYSNFFFKQC
jgi:hypothetical protein